MTILDRIEKLQQIDAFQPLRFSELALIAEVCIYREYRPGEKILPEGLVSDYLFIAVGGKLSDSCGMGLPPIIGAASLLLNRPLATAVEAGSSGAVCLLVKRGHFFTVMHECPALSAGFLKLLPQTAPLYRAEQTNSSAETTHSVKESR